MEHFSSKKKWCHVILEWSRFFETWGWLVSCPEGETSLKLATFSLCQSDEICVSYKLRNTASLTMPNLQLLAPVMLTTDPQVSWRSMALLDSVPETFSLSCVQKTFEWFKNLGKPITMEVGRCKIMQSNKRNITKDYTLHLWFIGTNCPLYSDYLGVLHPKMGPSKNPIALTVPGCYPQLDHLRDPCLIVLEKNLAQPRGLLFHALSRKTHCRNDTHTKSIPPGKDWCCNSHVLVYHGPLHIATFWEWLAIYLHEQVYLNHRGLGSSALWPLAEWPQRPQSNLQNPCWHHHHREDPMHLGGVVKRLTQAWCLLR